MDLKELEKKREEIAEYLNGISSPRLKLLILTEFIESLSQLDNKNIIESYLSEFLNEYLHLLKIFEPSGFEPSTCEKILLTLQKIISLNLFDDYKDDLIALEKSLIKRFDDIKGALAGGETTDEERLYFPVLEHQKDNENKIGFLDFIDIKISKKSSADEDTFIIIPSSEKIEKRLNEQVKNSWAVALEYAKGKSIKLEDHHEVVININKKYGEYAGNSLGLVLTLGFIEELLKKYHVRNLVKVNSNIAMTGGVDKNGNVLELPEEIITAKVAVAFFSSVKFLIVPKDSEIFALKKLSLLLETYPKRDLKIIGIESVYDLLDRRTLIDIKKINFAVYYGFKITRRRYTLAFILLLLVLTSYFFLKNYNDNPDIIDISNHILNVENKYGSILWSTKLAYSDQSPLLRCEIDQMVRIFDVNDDGKDEVIIASEAPNDLKDKKDLGRIACFDYKHKLIWKYLFRDSIQTRGEKFTPYYSLKILAIKNDMPEPEILLVGQHENYYPSPIIKLRLKDRKMVGDIFWHPGGGSRGFVKDINGDGKDELVATSISNGLERCVLYCIEYDKLKGTAPTTPDYRFLNQRIADFEQYIILPKSDVNKYYQYRYNFLATAPFITYDSLIYFNLIEDYLPDKSIIAINYEFDCNFRLKSIIIGDKFRVVRDSLVAEGKIKGPYTETPEYKKYLRNQIKYWNGSKFISINDFEKK